ncbi:MAG TPA: HAMP domain-containing sensor histidine kinase, partial [Candidatus Paceibacterota bacterium]
PLTSIRWAAENLNRAVTAEEKGRDLALISEASLRLEELTDRLVGLTDTNVKGKYNYEKTDLHELAVTLLAYYVAKSSEKHITIVDTIATDVTAVVDRERIKFVFQIILDNAVTYTPPGGKIIVRLERNKENVLFTVKDSGIGFTKEERPYLFNKFFRTEDAKRLDTEGMGLGMYLAKEIIEIHGGTITATSEGRNMGALFVASVPLERATR